ncbi:proprotein convertase subtilisin/kexin type 5-like [Anopheles funestus]|uniref:proprotein convertase subtilisin/kexin type 5-like n=1 Tax=Anopheles funestus TaxID=62324 RepID=UPI0020C6F7D9|nr:proprotein convertase subtilisin/kexin type 5-like [Anopheles funestus]
MKLLTGTLVTLLICFQFFDTSQAFVSQCLVCDSNQTECAEGSLKYIQSCPTGSEACFTSVTNGVLLRGCLSHLATTGVAQNCTEEEGHGCISCTENGCNTAPWLRCAHCDNDVGPDKCIDRQFVVFCPQYRSSDRCFEIVEGVEFKSISKGCESTLELAGNTCDPIERCRVVEKNSSNCTVETSLKTPVQCLVCSSENDSNEECVNGTLPGQNCPQEEDVCFSRVKGNTLERNCLSTLPPAERDVCTGEDSSCVTCSDSGCNTDRLLQCVQCKKSDNIECIDLIISSTLKPSFCPSFLPEARCFSRIVEDDLERGCSSESAGICVGNNRCLSCAADGCNVESETYLNNVAKCFRCTSNNGDNEACDEVYLGSEECDQLEDTCFMRVQGDILERNCLSTLVEEDQQKCRDGEYNSCYSCSGFGCNQHPRLKCYRCSSLLDPRCANPEENDLGYIFCDSFLPDDRCYTRIVDQHVERGCEVDLNNHDEDVCAGDPICFACHSSGCNDVDENTLKNMAKCISCSTERDGEECDKAAMEAEQCDHFEDVCFTRVLGNNLQRGCLLTLEENEQTKCRDESNKECITCQSPSCNNQPWLKCLSCKKSNNPVCSDPASVSQEHELASFCTKYDEKAACYARITEEDLVRGCSMELSNPNEVCADTVACEICTTDKCNVQTEDSLLSFSKCVQCTSGDVNSDCNKQLPGATKCPEKNDKCITRVFDGVLTRDCLSLLEDAEKLKCNDPKDLSCIVCEEPGCNQNQWTKCHQCVQSNSAGCEDEQSESDAELCKLYNANEECYIKLDQNHQLTRGCVSDVGTKDELCVDAEFCITCQGDSCNKAPESSLVPLACQQCTSADDECLAGTIESRPCPLLDDRCYTTVNSEKLLERGCLSTLSEDMQEICKNESDPSCTVCAENGCNEDRWPRCYRCNSSAFDDSCDHKLRPDLLEFCPSYHENTLCYAAIEQGSVTRDCTHEQVNICEGNNRCVACKDEGCNDVPKQQLNTIHTCYQCRSDVEDCDHLKDHVRECGERNDRCYTRVDEDLILHRGCLSDIDAVECENSEHCLTCTDKNCNNAPWAKCFQCNNSTNERCSSKQTFDDNLKYCQQYARHGECYTMLDPIDFRRGCTSDLDDVPCNIPEDCVQCKGDGCNRESLKSYFNPAHCLRCHSDMHIGCINGTAPALACANPDDVCFYRRASTKAIHRGCLSELTATDQRMCQSTTSSACHTCDENGCNTPKWRSCYKCSSHVDESCAEKQTKGTFLEFCLKIDDDCFENNNHGEIYRGCGRHYCGEKKTCVECGSDACNERAESALRPSHCLVCESTDPFCANGTSMNQYCDYLNEPCFTLVRDDGILERGCFSKLHESYKNKCLDETDRSCVACNSNSCNRDPWRQCVQCRSLELDQYCSRETSLLKSHFCSRFQRNDLCYAKDVQGIVIRGCQSDYSTQEDPCEGLEKRNCYTCDSDHCNVKTLNGVDYLNSMEKWTFVVLALLQGFLSWY